MGRKVGEYLESVNDLIDTNFPEGTEVRAKDLKIIAALTAHTVLGAIQTTTETDFDTLSVKEEN